MGKSPYPTPEVEKSHQSQATQHDGGNGRAGVSDRTRVPAGEKQVGKKQQTWPFPLLHRFDEGQIRPWLRFLRASINSKSAQAFQHRSDVEPSRRPQERSGGCRGAQHHIWATHPVWQLPALAPGWIQLSGPGESCTEASSSPFQSSAPASGGTATPCMVLLCRGGGG